MDLLSNPKFAVAAFIFGFGFLIFVHEMGHFLVAKAVGIRATQFAIGFGHALCSYRPGMGLRFGGTEKEYWKTASEALAKDGVSLEGLSDHEKTQKVNEKADALGLGETEYRLNYLPLGGYVKMLGQEDLDPSAQSDDPRSFNRRPIWARMLVISAGVVMNLIFALIFFVVCFSMGVDFAAPVVGQTTALKPASLTYATGHDGDLAYRGLRPGDTITHVNGAPIQDLTEIKIATALGKAGTPVSLTVDRAGEAAPLTYDITARADARQEGMLSAGILPASTLEVGYVIEDSAFAQANVQAGMILTAVDHHAVADYGAYVSAVNQAGGKPVVLTFHDPDTGNEILVPLTPQPAFRSTGADQVELVGITPAVEISFVGDDTPAQEVGIEAGDLIAQLGDQAWPTVEDVFALAAAAGRDPLAVSVFRDGKTLDLGKATTQNGRLGIGLIRHLTTARIGRVLADSPLAHANLPAGSKIESVNGQPVANWTDLQREMIATPEHQYGNTVLEVKLNLADGPIETTAMDLDGAPRAALTHAGWNPAANIGFEGLKVNLKAANAWDATKLGVEKSRQFIQQTYITLLRLFQGSVGVKNLRGPVGIVDQGSKIAKEGFAYYLFFLGLISVNLAVLNFLPLPIVDGGHMVFLTYEKLAGKPASPTVQTVVSLIGLVCLASLFLYITFNDISRLITG